MPKTKTITWLPEKVAAAMIGYAPRTMRKYAKLRKLPVYYTTTNGRSFKYCREDIEAFLLNNSNIPLS